MSKQNKHLSVADLNKVLPAETAEKFSIVNPGKRTSTKFICEFGLIDLKTLTVQRAEQLVKLKAPFIERKSKK